MRSELEKAIALLGKRDAESFQHALGLLRKTVFSFSMKVCGHREDAEDTVQEVLLKSLPHLTRLQDPQALSAWLYTAAKNRCWQSRRRASYQRSVPLDALAPDEAELKTLLLADAAPDPERQASRQEDHQLLHQAVLCLPVQYRIVLVLHDMEELDTEQLAKILSLQPGTVRIRLHRARLMMRKEMAKLLQGAAEKPSAKKAARKAATRRGPECREIFSNLSDYLDGRLQPETCDRMRHHIEACPACVAFIRDLKRAIDRCRSLDLSPDSEASPVLRRLLTQEYLRLLKKSPPDL